MIDWPTLILGGAMLWIGVMVGLLINLHMLEDATERLKESNRILKLAREINHQTGLKVQELIDHKREGARDEQENRAGAQS